MLPDSQRAYTCFSSGRRGGNCHCFCPHWPESANWNSDYMLLGQDVKLVWKSVGNSNRRTFLSYLCMSTILFLPENYLYHLEFPSTGHDFEIPWFLEIIHNGKKDEMNQ